MLTPAQFLYVVAKDADEKELEFMEGRCHLCGGRLFNFQGFFPVRYKNEFGWRHEGLARARESELACPACRYLYGNTNNNSKLEFSDPGRPLKGLLKYDRRGVNAEEEPIALAAIIASKERGFQAFNKEKWAEFRENLFDPPDPPFLVLATENRDGIQYGPWQSIIALSRDVFPVYFSYNVEVGNSKKKNSVVNNTILWLKPSTFSKAVELVEECFKNHIRIPGSPDWVLARKCAKKINEEENKSNENAQV